MNRYTFIIDTDTIKQDNIFTIFEKNFADALLNILTQSSSMESKYLNISLVYTDDITLKDKNYDCNIKI
jgi:hypothetical protein